MGRRWLAPTWLLTGALVVAAACGDSATTTDAPPEATTSTSTTATTIASITTVPPPATTMPPSPTTTAAPSTTQAEHGFRSPTGNIHCAPHEDGVRCSHHADPPWMAGGALPHWAEGVSFDFSEAGCIDGGFVGFEVAATGRPMAACGDSLTAAPEVTLEYGERRTVGGVSCLSQRFGMTCLNADGHGFRMATNEIAMLYDRPAGWETPSSSTADEQLVATTTTALDGPSKVATESGDVSCYLSSPGAAAFVECRSMGPASSVDWSPDGRSCAGADFLGYYLDDDTSADSHRVATFGCTTDVSPLVDPSVPAQSIAAGEAVTLGGITCLGAGPAIACHNPDGNGVLIAVDEVSFFYGRDV